MLPLNMVFRFSHACQARTISAAVEFFIGLDAVPDDLTAAMITDRRQLVDGAFEAVERVSRSGCDHVKG